MTETIVVTGFGPFRGHAINASWEAVKLIPSMQENDLNIIIKEIPVSYEEADTLLKDLWQNHQPKLVIHVGVSSETNKIQIEKLANRIGYYKPDCNAKLHPTKEVCLKEEGLDKIFCGIDVIKVCNDINILYKNEIVCASDDAGRYLCEYVFYKSLNIDRNRTMFLHVPPLKKPFSAVKLAEYILEIIKLSVKQLHFCECNK